jgi:hypothetical protein
MATQTKPAAEATERKGKHGLESQGLKPSGTVHWKPALPR